MLAMQGSIAMQCITELSPTYKAQERLWAHKGRLPCPSPFPAHFLNVQPSFSIPLPLDLTHGNLGQEVSPNLTSMIPYASWEYEQKLDR